MKNINKKSLIIALIISFIIVLNIRMSLFWDTVLPILIYLIVDFVLCIIMRDFGNLDFPSAVLTLVVDIISLFAATAIILKVADSIDLYSQFILIILVVGMMTLIKWIIAKLFNGLPGK